MKKIICFCCLLLLFILLCSCPAWYSIDIFNDSTERQHAQITFTPNEIDLSSDLTVTCSNAPIFKNMSDEKDNQQWCLDIVSFGVNEYKNQKFYYNNLFGSKGATLVEKE